MGTLGEELHGQYGNCTACTEQRRTPGEVGARAQGKSVLGYVGGAMTIYDRDTQCHLKDA